MRCLLLGPAKFTHMKWFKSSILIVMAGSLFLTLNLLVLPYTLLRTEFSIRINLEKLYLEKRKFLKIKRKWRKN